MKGTTAASVACALGVWAASLASGRQPPRSCASATTAEHRALAYLAREVPRWSTENKCYSCHNNGDAARALYVGKRLGYDVAPKALNDTSHWLARPQGWDRNGGETGISDKRLARIQFAAALREAMAAGLVRDRRPLREAAQLVAADQDKDGSWQVDAVGSV